jgi:hypothetical protein
VLVGKDAQLARLVDDVFDVGRTVALTDADGQLIATLSLAELQKAVRRGEGADPPAATDAYTPTRRQRELIDTRDRGCRWPCCPNRAGLADHDHVVSHAAGGATTCTNLCCLCRHHHRLVHQASGWTMAMTPDGGLRWTAPGGQTVTTHPIGYGTDDDLPPPPTEAAPATVRKPVGTLEYLRNWRPRPADPNEEPAPF